MAHIRVSVLGPAQVEVDGQAATVSPRALRVLMRLVAAEGRPVGVKQLRWDLGREVDRPHEARSGRNQVQKGISDLRRALAAGGVGTTAAACPLRTERLLNGQEPESAYRLVLDAESLDAAEFGALVSQALHGTAASAADLLSRAVALWRGRPPAEAAGAYARGLIRAPEPRYLTPLREL